MERMVHWRGYKFNDFNGDGICRRDRISAYEIGAVAAMWAIERVAGFWG